MVFVIFGVALNFLLERAKLELAPFSFQSLKRLTRIRETPPVATAVKATTTSGHLSKIRGQGSRGEQTVLNLGLPLEIVRLKQNFPNQCIQRHRRQENYEQRIM